MFKPRFIYGDVADIISQLLEWIPWAFQQQGTALLCVISSRLGLFDAVQDMSLMMPTQEERLMAGGEEVTLGGWDEHGMKVGLQFFCKLGDDEQPVYRGILLFDTPARRFALPTPLIPYRYPHGNEHHLFIHL